MVSGRRSATGWPNVRSLYQECSLRSCCCCCCSGPTWDRVEPYWLGLDDSLPSENINFYPPFTRNRIVARDEPSSGSFWKGNFVDFWHPGVWRIRDPRGQRVVSEQKRVSLRVNGAYPDWTYMRHVDMRAGAMRIGRGQCPMTDAGPLVVRCDRSVRNSGFCVVAIHRDPQKFVELFNMAPDKTGWICYVLGPAAD